MFTGFLHYKNPFHRGMYNFGPLCHNGSKVSMMKEQCQTKEERGRLARSVWRLAEHIFNDRKSLQSLAFPLIPTALLGINAKHPQKDSAHSLPCSVEYGLFAQAQSDSVKVSQTSFSQSLRSGSARN
jgi:hypothetical protein